MPLQISATGIQIQDLEEIIGEYNTLMQAEFGVLFKVGSGSVAGKVIGIAAEREALLQQLLLNIVTVLDPDNATGALLDILSGITNTERQEETKSKSENFLLTGTPATNIPNGKQFKNATTEDVWVIADGPYVIGGGGTIAATAEAAEFGALTFVTSGPANWTILTSVAGWTSVEASADIDPEEIGRADEQDGPLRIRRKDELLINGNDIDGIRALVLAVSGVTSVRTFENQTAIEVDGIPGGAFEVVVDGGDDTAIAVAIQSGRPPGAEAFGTTTVIVQNSELDNITIGLTRPADIDIFILVTCLTVGAEGVLPDNPEQVVLDAVLAYGNLNFNNPGVDVIPQSFVGDIFDALRDAQGKNSVTSVDVQLSYDNGAGVAPAFPVGFPAPGAGVDPYDALPRVIAIRERADFDSARIGVTIT